MGNRLFLSILIGLTGVIFLALGPLGAADKIEAPEFVILNTKGFKRDKKGPVKLSHIKHQTEYINEKGEKPIACTECHHDYQDGKNVWKEGQPVKKCHECHDPNKSDGKKKKLQLAMHADCKTCHKTLVKEKKVKKAPFKKCNDCHGKKS
jgi:hypothetical protein